MNLGPPKMLVGPEKVWRTQVSKPMVGPQGMVTVSHLCGQVVDLKALVWHMVVAWWAAISASLNEEITRRRSYLEAAIVSACFQSWSLGSLSYGQRLIRKSVCGPRMRLKL